MKQSPCIAAAGLLLGLATLAHAVSKAVVIVPVADLRSDQSLPTPGQSDEKQQTQLLLGETVEVVKSSGDWVYINAIEQPEFTTNQRWEGYPGWVLKSALQLNTVGKPRPASRTVGLRKRILKAAQQFMGTSYTWGGLSPSDPTRKTRLSGLDCSGLVHLAYRVNGLSVPRDSHEQWMKATPLKRSELLPADLIFSAKTPDPKKVTHVTLYAGGEQLVEAPQTGMTVRKVSFKEKYGADFSAVESGQTVEDRVIYFGRLLEN